MFKLLVILYIKDNWKCIAEKIKKNGSCIFLDLFSNKFPVILYIGAADGKHISLLHLKNSGHIFTIVKVFLAL